MEEDDEEDGGMENEAEIYERSWSFRGERRGNEPDKEGKELG